MKSFLATLATAAALLAATATKAQTPQPAPKAPSAPPFALTSTGFEDGAVIPDTYTAATPLLFQNSPPLEWRNAPAGTQSFVLLLHDIEGAINHRSDDVTHWLIYNIPAAATGLHEGIAPSAELPDGSVQAPNVRKQPGYLGPGARGIYHHYVFELFALDSKLSLPNSASREQVFEAMQGHILGKATLVGRYKRKD